MLSPRFLAVFAILAAASALPATDRPGIPQPITSIYAEDIDSPWFTFPLFGNLFAPLWKLFPSFADIGPKIIADDDKFQVIVNVKDYKKDDLKVKVKGDFIFIQGTHEGEQDGHDVFASQFFHTYTLPVNSSGSDVKADLYRDSYLVVSAPVNGRVDRTKEVDREVPITETGKVYKEESDDKPEQAEKPESSGELEKPLEPEKPAEPVKPVEPVVSDKVPEPVDKPERTTAATTTTTVADVEEKKEPTTPSEREDVTEKDNVIPHGNEIQP